MNTVCINLNVKILLFHKCALTELWGAYIKSDSKLNEYPALPLTSVHLTT